MVHSLLKFRLNRKGYAAVIATIFMVLAVLFLYFNVFMFIQSQDTKYQDVVSQSQQLDQDRANEQIQINIQNILPFSGDTFAVQFIVNNTGVIPVKIERAWVIDPQSGKSGASPTLSLVLAPGAGTAMTTNFTIPQQSISGDFLELVTSHGNLVIKQIP
jgi:hypothetical protein